MKSHLCIAKLSIPAAYFEKERRLPPRVEGSPPRGRAPARTAVPVGVREHRKKLAFMTVFDTGMVVASGGGRRYYSHHT